MSSPGGHRPVAELEQALGLSFRNRGLLVQALTHRSYVNDTGGATTDSYERLEFLGDVVLRLIVSDELYRRLPERDEGGLTRRLAAVVSQRSLAAVAAAMELAEYALLGRGAESAGDRYSEGIQGDVMESMIAAVYLDAGYDAARRFALTALSDAIDATCQPGWRPDNPKAELQEMLQAQGQPTPVYRVANSSGPAHRPQFDVEALVDGQSLGSGSGRSKGAAETEAARAALVALRCRPLNRPAPDSINGWSSQRGDSPTGQ